MSCRNLLGLPERRSSYPDGLETESGIPCIDPRGGGWFGRLAEQSPLTETLGNTPLGDTKCFNLVICVWRLSKKCPYKRASLQRCVEIFDICLYVADG